MEAADVRERLAEASEASNNKRLATYIAALAALLAVATLGGNNAAEDKANENISASDTWAFYQAKNVRQTQYRLSADALELEMRSRRDLDDEARKAYQDTITRYRGTADRYETEPQTGEGKKELVAKAKQHEAARDRAEQQGPWFDGAEAALQLAIVLASVAAIVEVPALLIVSGILAVAGALATANGFLLIL